MTMTVKTYALVRNASGAPEIYERDITLGREAYDNGDHYDAIEAAADEDGYEFISAFDENDPAGRQFAPRQNDDSVSPLDASLSGALQACVEQIEQMKGMFGDEDGTIQDALDAAEDALNCYHKARERVADTSRG